MRTDIPDSFPNKGWVLIHGKKAPILGRVCMDQFMVDVTDIPEVKAGDEVTLMGRDGDEFISVETLGDLSGRFSYEFVCEDAADLSSKDLYQRRKGMRRRRELGFQVNL